MTMPNTHETPSHSPWDAFSAAWDEQDTATLDAPAFETETLIAYHRGQLDAAEVAEVQRQLASSPAMVAELLDLQAFAAPDAADRAPLSSAAMEDAWATFEASIDADQETADTAPAPVVDFAAARRAKRPAPRRTTHRWWIAAAAAVLAVVGLRSAGPFDTLAPVETASNTKAGVFVASFEDGALDSEWTLNDSRPASNDGTLFDAQFESESLGAEWTLSAPSKDSKARRDDAPLLQDDFEPEAGQLNGWQIVGPANLEA